MKRCSKCILPETYPGITFNHQGVCSLCENYMKTEYQGKEELLRVADKLRNGDPYDCMVALSGGRDSTFVAYYAVNELKLNVLAVTIDNGFIPQQVRKNIKCAVERLGIDHQYFAHDHMKHTVKHIMRSWMHSPSPGMISLLCTGCTTGIMSGLVKAAQENKISAILGGGGDIVGSGGEPEASFAEGLMSLSANPRLRSLSIGLGFMREFFRNPRYLSNLRFSTTLLREFLYRFAFKLENHVQPIGLFEYIRWDEDEIKSVIQGKLGWKKPKDWQSSWRADCKIHLLKEYLYRETIGFTKNNELLSGMIREDMITREGALVRLEHDNKISSQFLADFLSQYEIELGEVDNALNRYKKKMTG